MDIMTSRVVSVAPLVFAILTSFATGTTDRVAEASAQQGGPGQRLGHALVYDEHRGGIVLLDGNWPQSQGARSDLWRWDGRHWERLAATDSPATWMGAAAGDTRRRRVISHGGRDHHGAVGALWEWDGAQRRRATDSTPGARFHHAMAYDASRGRTVMYGGATGSRWDTDTWEWDGSAWKRLAVPGPGPRAAFRMVYDSERRVVVLFGGIGPPKGDGQAQEYLGDTWIWNGTAWRQVSVSGPPGRRDYSIAFDERRGAVLLYGGAAGSGPATRRFDDMWQWDGGTWRQIPLRDATPGHRYVSAMAYDRARDRTVLYGGYTCDRTRQCGVAGDTWEWDGMAWLRVGEP